MFEGAENDSGRAASRYMPAVQVIGNMVVPPMFSPSSIRKPEITAVDALVPSPRPSDDIQIFAVPRTEVA